MSALTGVVAAVGDQVIQTQGSLAWERIQDRGLSRRVVTGAASLEEAGRCVRLVRSIFRNIFGMLYLGKLFSDAYKNKLISFFPP